MKCKNSECKQKASVRAIIPSMADPHEETVLYYCEGCSVIIKALYNTVQSAGAEYHMDVPKVRFECMT